MIKRAKQSWEQWKQQQPSLADEPPPTPFPRGTSLLATNLVLKPRISVRKSCVTEEEEEEVTKCCIRTADITFRIATGLSSSTKKKLIYVFIYLIIHLFI